MDNNNVTKCESWASDIRRSIIELCHDAGKKGVHIGSALSVVDILSVLYGHVLRYDAQKPESMNRDFFILSKGHAYTALYATLCKAGYFSAEEMRANFMTDNGLFPVHPVKNVQKGIEFSGGSLGTGIGFAIGKAYAMQLDKRDNRVYALLGDGECDEGSVWEAFLSAASLHLSNLTAIIDKNSLQQDGATDDVLKIDLTKMLEACGWNTLVVDGHSATELLAAFDKDFGNDKPKCIIANTIKGKGVSFMEGDNYWHHAFMTEKQYEKATEELK